MPEADGRERLAARGAARAEGDARPGAGDSSTRATLRPHMPTTRPLSPLTIALAGAVALAVAMGIGRFAFTPLLPMMLAEGALDLHTASWLASANYFGYLTGALLCTFQPLLRRALPWLPRLGAAALIHAGLVATAVLTLAMAVPWPAAWAALR